MVFLSWKDTPWCIYLVQGTANNLTAVRVFHTSGKQTIIGLNALKRDSGLFMARILGYTDKDHPATDDECMAVAEAILKIKELPSVQPRGNPVEEARQKVERSLGLPASLEPNRS